MQHERMVESSTNILLQMTAQSKKVYKTTRNAWQSLADSPLGVVVSSSSEYLWNTPNYWSPQCLAASPPRERS